MKKSPLIIILFLSVLFAKAQIYQLMPFPEKIDKKLMDEFSKVKGKKTLPFNAESDLTDYLQLYADLAK